MWGGEEAEGEGVEAERSRMGGGEEEGEGVGEEERRE